MWGKKLQTETHWRERKLKVTLGRMRGTESYWEKCGRFFVRGCRRSQLWLLHVNPYFVVFFVKYSNNVSTGLLLFFLFLYVFICCLSHTHSHFQKVKGKWKKKKSFILFRVPQEKKAKWGDLLNMALTSFNYDFILVMGKPCYGTFSLSLSLHLLPNI